MRPPRSSKTSSRVQPSFGRTFETPRTTGEFNEPNATTLLPDYVPPYGVRHVFNQALSTDVRELRSAKFIIDGEQRTSSFAALLFLQF